MQFFPSMTPTRRNRLLLVTGLLLLVLGLLWVARGALGPYILALVMGYLVLPIVNRLDGLLRRLLPGIRFTRPIAILATYLLVIALVVLFFALVVPVIGQQFTVLWDNREDLMARAQSLGERFLVWYRVSVPQEIQAQVSESLSQVGGTITGALQKGVTRTVGVVTGTIASLIGFLVIPFWLFYVLNDQLRATRGLVTLIPARIRADALNLIRICDGIMSKYLRGQLLLCVSIGVLSTLGLTLLGVQSPAVLGLIAGIFEILPFIGPFIGLVPAAIVAAIQSPLLGVWTVLLFLGIQQVENLFLVPRISGKAVQLHPALIMVVLVLGSQIAGFWGLLLAVPVTAMVRDVFKYLYLRLQDEPLSPKAAMVELGRTPLQLEV